MLIERWIYLSACCKRVSFPTKFLSSSHLHIICNLGCLLGGNDLRSEFAVLTLVYLVYYTSINHTHSMFTVQIVPNPCENYPNESCISVSVTTLLLVMRIVDEDSWAHFDFLVPVANVGFLPMVAADTIGQLVDDCRFQCFNEADSIKCIKRPFNS